MMYNYIIDWNVAILQYRIFILVSSKKNNRLFELETELKHCFKCQHTNSLIKIYR